MNLTAAVQGYRTWMNPLAGTVRLGAPAVTNGEGASMGLAYLKAFLARCTDCHIDFVPIHWHGGVDDVSGFKKHVREAYRVAGKRPLWITEIGPEGGSKEETLAFLKKVVRWMDGEVKVERYAWFMDKVEILISDDGKSLSELGRLYNSG